MCIVKNGYRKISELFDQKFQEWRQKQEREQLQGSKHQQTYKHWEDKKKERQEKNKSGLNQREKRHKK